MLSPEYLERLPVGLVSQYAQLENYIIWDISRRISQANLMTPTAEWQIYKAQEMRMSYEEIQERVAQQTGKSKEEIKKIFEEASVKALATDGEIYKQMGKDPTPYFKALALNRTLAEGIKQTNGLMKNYTRTTAKVANKLFEDVLDQAYLEVQSGASSYQSAIRKAVNTLGRRGIQTVNYASGRTDQVDVAVRRAIITGVNQTAARLQIDLAHEMECDLVEVTAHFGARPDHAEWQGGIYSISGKDAKYRSLSDATGYGTGQGLCGYNCRHNFYPWFEGISKPLGNPYNSEESRTHYENTQKQRALERNIRKTKRELAALDGTLKDTEDEELKKVLNKDFNSKSVKLKQQEKILKDFIKEKDLGSRRDSVQVNEFGRSQAQKAIHANKKNDILETKKEQIREDIRNDLYPKQLNKGAQEKHVKGAARYIEGRSYLTISLQEAQEIVNKYAGTGDLVMTLSGNWRNQETIVLDKVIGIDINNQTGIETPTNALKIHYGKKGTHIVPKYVMNE